MADSNCGTLTCRLTSVRFLIGDRTDGVALLTISTFNENKTNDGLFYGILLSYLSVVIQVFHVINNNQIIIQIKYLRSYNLTLGSM